MLAERDAKRKARIEAQMLKPVRNKDTRKSTSVNMFNIGKVVKNPSILSQNVSPMSRG
jgi:hypothetical protein